MYQLGIKGEGYGKCLLIELEWLTEFMQDVQSITVVMSLLRQENVLSVIGWQRFTENKRWVATHIAALHYGLHNYFDEGVTDWRSSIGYIRTRFIELSNKTTSQLIAGCSCAGCKGIDELLESSVPVDAGNLELLFDFLAGK